MNFQQFIDQILYADTLVRSLYVCSVMQIPILYTKKIEYVEYILENNKLVSNNKKTNRQLRIYRTNDRKMTVQILPKATIRLSISFANQKLSRQELIYQMIILRI